MNMLLDAFICFCDSSQEVGVAETENVIKGMHREKIKSNGNFI